MMVEKQMIRWHHRLRMKMRRVWRRVTGTASPPPGWCNGCGTAGGRHDVACATHSPMPNVMDQVKRHQKEILKDRSSNEKELASRFGETVEQYRVRKERAQMMTVQDAEMEARAVMAKIWML